MTLFEIAIAMAVLASVGGLFLGSIAATDKQQEILIEKADPNGPGTAPGNRFRVDGFALAPSPDGVPGEIHLPVVTNVEGAYRT